MRGTLVLFAAVLLVLSVLLPQVTLAEQNISEIPHSIDRMLGEQLTYDISFLWFKRLAEGTISLSPGPEPGQYVALLEARTLGITAILTRNRVERIETLMEIGPDGSLRPLVQRAHSTKGEGRSKKERVRSYHFNYLDRTVLYKNQKTGKRTEEKTYAMSEEGPVYDILSAFYNVRSGIFGTVEHGRHLALPTFTRRGTDDIIVARVVDKERKRHPFFPEGTILCKVLVDPDTFKTKGRAIFVGFDEQMVPQRGVVKKVSGLGDVRGVLREVRNGPEESPILKSGETVPK